MSQKVHVETSIFSFLTARPSANVFAAAWQSVTLQWWRTRRARFDLYVSELVRQEAMRGNAEAAAKRLESMKGIALLHITEEAAALAKEFIRPGLLPRKAADDALHLALSVVHGMEFLLTWNCRHLDNAVIKPRLRVLLLDMGYALPEICTPQEMLGE